MTEYALFRIQVGGEITVRNNQGTLVAVWSSLSGWQRKVAPCSDRDAERLRQICQIWNVMTNPLFHTDHLADSLGFDRDLALAISGARKKWAPESDDRHQLKVKLPES